MFTKHLSAVSPAFAKQAGFGTTVEWPATDKIVGAPKNDGVTATVKQTPGAIGYIEYGFAKLTKTPIALLQNKAGKYVAADAKSGEAALAGAKLGPDLRGWVDDPDGPEAYPIATFTWLLFYKQQDAKKAEVLRKLVDYCATKGQAMADSLGYIPLPAPIVAKGKGGEDPGRIPVAGGDPRRRRRRGARQGGAADRPRLPRRRRDRPPGPRGDPRRSTSRRDAPRRSLDFSFSGLKTALVYKVRDLGAESRPASQADLAASFQRAVVDR